MIVFVAWPTEIGLQGSVIGQHRRSIGSSVIWPLADSDRHRHPEYFLPVTGIEQEYCDSKIRVRYQGRLALVQLAKYATL